MAKITQLHIALGKDDDGNVAYGMSYIKVDEKGSMMIRSDVSYEHINHAIADFLELQENEK